MSVIERELMRPPSRNKPDRPCHIVGPDGWALCGARDYTPRPVHKCGRRAGHVVCPLCWMAHEEAL